MDKGIVKRLSNTIPAPKGKTYLLAIGIDDYTYCPLLHNAVKDVKDFIDLMVSHYGFDTNHIKSLLNQEATHQNIIEEFKRLVTIVEPNDNVLIYFSGHGELDEILDEGFWIPVEAKQGNISQYIPNSTIHKVLNKINSFHTFLIVDSCYSGALFLEGKTKSTYKSYDFPSRWGLTSGRKTLVSDGKMGANSPFAKALLEILKIDRALNVSAVCDFVRQSVTAATDNQQMPIGDPLSISGHKSGQFIFEPTITEVKDWTNVLAENNITKVEFFLQKYPNGQFYKEASKLIEELKEEILWKDAVKLQSITGYMGYLQKSKLKKYASEARICIKNIKKKDKEVFLQRIQENSRQEKLKIEEQEETFWQNTLKMDMVAAYEFYLSDSLLKKYKKVANNRIKELIALQPNRDKEKTGDNIQKTKELTQDELLWQEALSINTKEGYEKYLNESRLLRFGDKAQLNRARLIFKEMQDILQKSNDKPLKAGNDLQGAPKYNNVGSVVFIMFYLIMVLNYRIRLGWFFSYDYPYGFDLTIFVMALVPPLYFWILFIGLKKIDMELGSLGYFLIILEFVYPTYNLYAKPIGLINDKQEVIHKPITTPIDSSKLIK